MLQLTPEKVRVRYGFGDKKSPCATVRGTKNEPALRLMIPPMVRPPDIKRPHTTTTPCRATQEIDCDTSAKISTTVSNKTDNTSVRCQLRTIRNSCAAAAPCTSISFSLLNQISFNLWGKLLTHDTTLLFRSLPLKVKLTG